jgi:hypothetical protein
MGCCKRVYKYFYLVSPTGFEGVCKVLSSSWGIPFQGFVDAA